MTTEQDVGYNKAVYLEKTAAVSKDDLEEFARLMGLSYNLSVNPIAASCFMWWPGCDISRVPEGCHVAIVQSHHFNQENRLVF